MLQLLIDPWIFPLQRIHCDCHQAAPEASNKGLKAKDLDCLLSTENYGLLFIWHVEFQNTATSSLPCHSSKSDCLGSLGRRIYISLPLNKESSLVRHKQIMRTCNTHQWCQQSWESPQEGLYFPWFPTITLESLYQSLHRKNGCSFSSALEVSCRQTVQPYPLSV